MIYADNAATTGLDKDAFEAMKPYLMNEYGNASQPYFFAKPAKKAISEARETVARCIGAEPDEIYFTSGGTESDNWVIKESALEDADKRDMITSQIEHHAILNSCKAIEKLKYPVRYLPVTGEGVVLPEELESIITDKTRLVSVMLANNEIGTIEPIEKLATIAHQHGALFHTDAVQAVGHIPIDVNKLGVDMLSASSHKFNGMKGSGFLYIRKGTKIGSYEDGGSQERGKRAGTENVAAIVAMAVALKKNCDKLAETTKRLTDMEKVLLGRLSSAGLDFIRNGSSNHLPGNVNISFKNSDGEMLLHRMDLKGICISTGSACDSKNTQISHVIKAINVPEEYAKGTIRISLGAHNEKDDTVQIADALIDILEK
jgi:cysteine desulfurase